MSFSQIFPLKDTTIYAANPNLNAGIDPIIELSKSSDFYPSRILLQFDPKQIDTLLKSKNITTGNDRNWKAYLRLYASQAEGLPEDLTVLVDPIFESWRMGTGRKANNPETQNGASWKDPIEKGTPWDPCPNAFGGTYYSKSFVDEGFIEDLTCSGPYGGLYFSKSFVDEDYIIDYLGAQSYTSGSEGGGTWYRGFTLSQSVGYHTSKDIWMDVTPQVEGWEMGMIENYGFILRMSESFENNDDYLYHLSYFSRDTNTIYPPSLIFYFDDSEFNPNPEAILNDHEFDVSLSNNGGIYQDEDNIRLRAFGREKYPKRVFQTSSFFEYNKTLPESSSFQIVDVDTNEAVIPFDDMGTKLSADGKSSYFEIDMESLEPERYYTIQIKTQIGNNTYVKNNNAMSFKVQQKV